MTVRIPGRRPHLLAALAHELQRAVELAEAPGARDLASVEALFRRIGFQRDEPTFETEAALKVEERVRQELAQSGTGGLSAAWSLAHQSASVDSGPANRP